MKSAKEVQSLAEKVFSKAGNMETEIIFMQNRQDLTRFAQNAIVQNVSQNGFDLSIRLLDGKRSAKVSTDQSDDASIAKAIDRAKAALKFQKEDPNALSLSEVPREKYTEQNQYIEKTAAMTPGDKVPAIERLVRRAEQNNLEAAGTFCTTESSVGYYTSTGIRAFQMFTNANFGSTVTGSQGRMGWAQESDKDVNGINFERVAETAIDKSLRSANPKTIEPGEYTVVLEPNALAELFYFIGSNFNARFHLEKRCFLAGKLGAKVFGDNISLGEDAYHPMTTGMSFDFEGLPRRAVSLVEKGVAKGVVHDRSTAKAMNTQSTGHANPQPNAWGPSANNLVLSAGDSSLEEMIASTKNGILVTKFHYTNQLEPMQITLTGMTRSGTFKIENGKVGHPVENMRFTIRLPEILNRVEALSKDRKFVSAFFGGGFVVPAAKIQGFHFSSKAGF